MRNSLKIYGFGSRKYRPFVLLLLGGLAICTILFLYFKKLPGNLYGTEPLDSKKHRNLTMIDMKRIRAYVMKCPVIEVTQRQNDSMAIILINSHVCNWKRRRLYRKAISDAELEKLGMRRIFLLGTLSRQQKRPHCNITQKEVEKEQRLHGDLLQGSMDDIWSNVELKDLMGLDFAARVARAFTYIVHMNDNALIDVYGMRKFLWHFLEINAERVARPDFLIGFLQPGDFYEDVWEYSENETTYENPDSFDYKYYDYEDQKPSRYPQYLESFFYVTNYRTALTLVWQAQALPPYLDTTIWITDILRETLRIPAKAFPIETDGTFEDIEKCLRQFKQKAMECPHLVHRCASQKEFNKLVEFQRNGRVCFEGRCKPDDWRNRILMRYFEWQSGLY